jgi:hypothetical protein
MVEFLLANNGVAPVPTVKNAASKIGIAERTLERARPQVAITIPRQAGEPASWKLLPQFIGESAPSSTTDPATASLQ